MQMPSRQILRPSSAVNYVFDGNSLFAGQGASPGKAVPALVAGRAPLLGSGATAVNVAVNGQSWLGMDGQGANSPAADVDGAWVNGKTNVLVLWETSNAVALGRTPAQAVADAQGYIANRRAAHPGWRIVNLTTIPRQAALTSVMPQADVDAMNAKLQAADDIFRANYRALGIDALVDVRMPGSPFRFTGYTPADFDAISSFWTEASGTRVHLNDAGYSLIADMVARTLRRLPARAA